MSTKQKTRPSTDLRALFIPVIFANGEDDDLPGFVAAFEGREVLYNDDIISPADPLLVYDRALRWKADKVHFIDDVVHIFEGEEVTRLVPIRREAHVYIIGCSINLGL